jgi:hypothetical protein
LLYGSNFNRSTPNNTKSSQLDFSGVQRSGTS